MKKIIALALSLILVLSLSVMASAATYGEDSTAPSIPNAPVTGAYVEGSEAAKLIVVDVEWTGLDFEFTAAQKTWDPTQHKDVDATEGTWTKKNGTITVENHSNVIITATAEYDAGEYDGNATITCGQAIELGVASEGENGISGTISVTAGGTLEKSDAAVDLGDIVITIAEKVAQQG